MCTCVKYLKKESHTFKLEEFEISDIEIVHNSVNWIKAREDCIKKGGKLSTEEEFGNCKDKTKGNKIWTGTHQILSPWLGKIGR